MTTTVFVFGGYLSRVKTLVWSASMYGSETWTIKKADATRLEAFEM